LDDRFKTLIPHGKKMHVKEILCYIYLFVHLFDSGILLINDLNKKKGNKGMGRGGGGEEFFL
jgi:hypothetical protein